MIKQLTIVGLGLIGGSLARALKQKDYCERIIGCGRDEAQLRWAQEQGLIDAYDTDPAQACRGSDVIVLAVPLGAMVACMRAIQPALAEHAVITDVGSAKASVVAAAQEVFGQVPLRFVPGHPIAGTENSGVQASFAELYQNRRVILTPLDHTDVDAVSVARDMWQVTGATVDEMSVSHHDQVLAATSHLPHVLAYGLVDTLANMDSHTEIFRFAAGGFRDFTRIASSDPVVWRDISLANREAILDVLASYRQDLDVLTSYIENGDGEALQALYERAKAARDKCIKQLES